MNRFPLLRRLLQLVAAAATAVLVLKAVIHGWQHQVAQQRFQRSVKEEDHGACVAAGEQLTRLRPLELAEARQLAHCRRLLATDYWATGEHQRALDLLERLIGSPQMAAADQLQLSQWVGQRKDLAIEHYRQGDLSTAVALLRQLSDLQEPQRDSLIESLEIRWTLNRQLHEQAGQLRAEERWWEALDAINRLDHPWWRAQTEPLQAEVVAATQALTGQGVAGRDSHNGRVRHNVPLSELDRRIRLHLTRRADDWQAYVQACHELGGVVVDYGPESACRR